MADLGLYGLDHRQISAHTLTRSEFDHIKSTYHTAGLECVECHGGMYPQLRTYYDGTRQLFAHMPGTLETCPARRDETPTHHDLKHLVASIAEQRLGLRALIDERKFAGLKPDVLLYDPTATEANGPRAVYEIQQSPLDLATFDSRDTRLNSALRKLSTGTFDRRVAPWIFTHEPTYETTRALLEVAQTLDGEWKAYGGIWKSADRDGFTEAPLADAMADMHAGRIVRLEESEYGSRITYWTRFNADHKPRRPAHLSTQDWESAPCDRPPTRPKRNAFRNGDPVCEVCGNPIMWTTTRSTHLVCETAP